MSYRARLVVRAVEDALTALDHHPTLFAKYLRNDRSVVAVSRALSTHKRLRREVGGRRGDMLDAGRVDRDWEQREAERRRERFDKRKLGLDGERRGHRATMTTIDLHRLALERQARLSTVPAGSIAPSRGGGDPTGPPLQALLDTDPRWQQAWAIVRRRLERAHELLDEAEGLGAAAATMMSGAEKDRLILDEGERLKPIEVVELLGVEIAGSAETVRRVRRAAGLRSGDGLPSKDPPK